MLFVCHPKISHKHCLQFLLGVKIMVSKLFEVKIMELWYVIVFLQWSIDFGSSYWIPGPLSVEIGFRILIVFEILDSLSCIPDSKAQEPDSQKEKFLGFPEFGFPYSGLN